MVYVKYVKMVNPKIKVIWMHAYVYTLYVLILKSITHS